MKANILWIERQGIGTSSFIPKLRIKGFTVDLVSTGKDALTYLSNKKPNLLVINIVSLRTNGKRILTSIRRKAHDVPLLIIINRENVVEYLKVDAILTLPFTVRKLLNNIFLLVPSENPSTIQVGPIILDIERNRVKCQDREATLTPRLVLLLRHFLEHPGELIERERLFSKVWNTTYTADTRTLDVHISWLRKAIEENPRRPKFLKTIPGVGYQLDVV